MVQRDGFEISSERQPVSKGIQKNLHPFEDGGGIYDIERGPGKGNPSPLDFAQESPTSSSNSTLSSDSTISSYTSGITVVSINQYHIVLVVHSVTFPASSRGKG